jgi:hypothetical protein
MAVPYLHSFEGPIDRFGVGKTRKVWYTVLFLPPDLVTALPFAIHPRLRVEGEIADLPVEGAWMPTGDGRRYFIVAPRVLKGATVGVGDMVEMRFGIADQTAVEVPAELAAALACSPNAQAAWMALTPGKQRGLTHRIHGAKAPATRRRRTDEVIAMLTGDVS